MYNTRVILSVYTGLCREERMDANDSLHLSHPITAG